MSLNKTKKGERNCVGYIWRGRAKNLTGLHRVQPNERFQTRVGYEKHWTTRFFVVVLKRSEISFRNQKTFSALVHCLVDKVCSIQLRNC